MTATLPAVSEVDVPAVDPERFAAVLDEAQMSSLRDAIGSSRHLLRGRAVWNINSTAQGGGVAEMLASLLPYARGAGVDARWLVIGGDGEFFRITKRIHNRLHGASGEGLDERDRDHYEKVLAAQLDQLTRRVRPGDVVIAHDPQTAGLVPHLAAWGAQVVWRCHVGLDTPNADARGAWDFLLPYVRRAQRCIFSRRCFAWEGIDEDAVVVIPPSIDPFSAKNCAMDEATADAVLAACGVVDVRSPLAPDYARADGSRGRIDLRAALVEASRLGPATRFVLQVSRWDRLKDHLGVLDGFVAGVAGVSDAHLVLVGPSVAGVSDDPEGAATYEEVRMAWEALDTTARARVHLVNLPMDDVDQNGAMVNALQRRATVVVQKSLAEGFGLTVTEAMWKSRPVVASRIGGIQDQIEDGVSGVLLDDPSDRPAFAAAVRHLLGDDRAAARMGEQAKARITSHFLDGRHLVQYAELCGQLV